MLRREFLAFGGAVVGLITVSPVLADTLTPTTGQGRRESRGDRRQALAAHVIRGTISSFGSPSTLWSVSTKDHGTVTVDVSKAKVHAGKSGGNTSLSQFQVGNDVVILLSRQTPASSASSSTTLVAAAVGLMPQRQIQHFVGTANGPVANNSLTITLTNGQGTQTFTIDSNTKIKSGRSTADVTAIQSGTTVTVIAKVGSTTASAIMIHPTSS